jgi:hypothetical protein
LERDLGFFRGGVDALSSCFADVLGAVGEDYVGADFGEEEEEEGKEGSVED